jgi:hypothetical protein
MSDARSTHIPEYAGGVATVPASGSLEVETGLRNVQAVSAVLAEDSVATAAAVSVEIGDPPQGGNQKITLKTWAADGATAGSTVAKVSWMALGK